MAEADLFGLYDYIEARSGHGVASGFVDRIQVLCDSLNTMPERGVSLGRGLRSVAMERRVQVVYRVTPNTVEILRVLYAGRDFDPDDLAH